MEKIIWQVFMQKIYYILKNDNISIKEQADKVIEIFKSTWTRFYNWELGRDKMVAMIKRFWIEYNSEEIDFKKNVKVFDNMIKLSTDKILETFVERLIEWEILKENLFKFQTWTITFQEIPTKKQNKNFWNFFKKDWARLSDWWPTT